MGFARAHNDITSSTESAFDNGDIDNVVMVGSPGELAYVACLVRVHRLDVAAGEHVCKAGLARPAPPSLSEDGCRDNRHDLLSDEPHVQRPHPSVIALPGNERAGIISDPGH
jgi:hypothetical protein